MYTEDRQIVLGLNWWNYVTLLTKISTWNSSTATKKDTQFILEFNAYTIENFDLKLQNENIANSIKIQNHNANHFFQIQLDRFPVFWFFGSWIVQELQVNRNCVASNFIAPNSTNATSSIILIKLDDLALENQFWFFKNFPRLNPSSNFVKRKLNLLYYLASNWWKIRIHPLWTDSSRICSPFFPGFSKI